MYLRSEQEEFLYSNTKFKALLVIYKEVIVTLYIKGYCSKFIISINFLIVRAVYIVVSSKILFFTT